MFVQLKTKQKCTASRDETISPCDVRMVVAAKQSSQPRVATQHAKSHKPERKMRGQLSRRPTLLLHNSQYKRINAKNYPLIDSKNVKSGQFKSKTNCVA
jgi:hypothetical protein